MFGEAMQKSVSMVYVCFFYIGTAQAQNCPYCPNEDCKWLSNTGWTCSYGCKNGSWTNDCSSPCKDTNCQNCARHTGVCSICNSGYYILSNKTCISCDAYTSIGCLCKSDDVCYDCLEGYNFHYNETLQKHLCQACADGLYGSRCVKKCSAGCSSVCNKKSGTCSCKPNYTGDKCEMCKPYFTGKMCELCVEGWYGTECNQLCERNCVSCHAASSCISCQPGFYGHICQDECPSTCESCNSSDECTTCKLGYYGRSCESNCSTGCLKKQCDKNTASCTPCTNGYAGQECADECSIGCNHGICHQLSRECTYRCKDGFYGLKCEKCPVTCMTCTSPQICGTCVSGRYGYLCGNQCPDNCQNCNGNGECTSCKAGFSYTNLQCQCSNALCTSNPCRSCNNSTYYPNEYACCPCSINCKHSVCSSDVQCTQGCEDGYYGTGCKFPCTKLDKQCVVCSGVSLRNFKCTRCIEEYHPNEIGVCISCFPNCLNRKCNSSTGYCANGCKDGFWNPKCDDTCPENCTVCDQDSGQCLKCSTPNMYGNECKKQCNSTCVNESCHMNGTCISGCIPNYFGSSCDTPCPSNCARNGNQSRCSPESGLCSIGCSAGFTGDNCTETLVQGSYEDTVTAVTIGGVVAAVVIVAIVIAFGLYIFLRRRNREPKTKLVHEQSSNEDNASAPVYATVVRSGKKDNTGMVYANTSTVEVDIATPPDPVYTNDARHLTMKIVTTEESLEIDELDNIARQNAIRFEENGGVYYNNDSEVKNFKIPVAELQKFVMSKNRDYFKTEFEKLPYGLLKDYSVSQMKANISKNRYKDIYPYDDHRVKVIGGDTDYINASFIDGFKRRNEYIATLGPMSKQLVDFSAFWRMVWQQKVEKIVMVTNLVEGEIDKCEQYWPNVGVSRMYGDVRVLCQTENLHAEFTRRTFTIEKDKEERTLAHLHFTSWPDKDVPDDVTSIIEFRQNVLDAPSTLGGPTIVHCSAGIGRTGTYIAIDILINEGKSQGTVDIAGCVLNMRQNRPNMVQTSGQYEFLHHAVVHALTVDRKPE